MVVKEIDDERKSLERETGAGKWGNGTSYNDLRVNFVQKKMRKHCKF